MFQLFDISYHDLIINNSQELYKLRKRVFYDRLGWQVNNINNMEFDEYDTFGTRYILGVYNHQLICSVRFITLDRPNMITHTFHEYFNDVNIPKKGIESSRFFVDKNLSRRVSGFHYPVSYILFLSMINFARRFNFDGVYTIVSDAMLTILIRSGWQIVTIKKSNLSLKDNIHLIFLPSDDVSQKKILEKIQKKIDVATSALLNWPVSLPVIGST